VIQDLSDSPGFWASSFTAFLLAILCAYRLSRRRAPGALPFVVACVFGILWTAGAAMEQAVPGVTAKIFWVKFQMVWQVPSGTAVTCFLLEYTRPRRWLTRRNLALLSIPSLLVLLSVATNHLHHLFWRGFRFEGAVVPLPGPLNWAIVAVVYGLGVVNIIILGGVFLRSPQHRWPVAIILIG
jgi:hypothetical protein